ncbi:MAG: hypothetical protein KDA85_01395, partial [Planctomycetaceae bacterium]|nr:hypothetical protein [Planctomycetaceae bacterium]
YPTALQVPVTEFRDAGRSAFRGSLPFLIPKEDSIPPGDYSFRLSVSFPLLRENGPRFFVSAFEIQLPEQRSGGPRRIVVRGSGILVRSSLKDFDDVVIEGNAIQATAPLFADNEPPAEPVRQPLNVTLSQSQEGLFPKVISGTPATERRSLNRGMLWLDHSDRRLYFFSANPILRLGRHSERSDVVLRFFPSSRGR